MDVKIVAWRAHVSANSLLCQQPGYLFTRTLVVFRSILSQYTLKCAIVCACGYHATVVYLGDDASMDVLAREEQFKMVGPH